MGRIRRGARNVYVCQDHVRLTSDQTWQEVTISINHGCHCNITTWQEDRRERTIISYTYHYLHIGGVAMLSMRVMIAIDITNAHCCAYLRCGRFEKT